MSQCIIHLDEIYVTLYMYTHNLDEDHVMNDYDAAYVWDYEISCHDDNLDESYAHNTWELDDEYRRDSHDYTELAYTYFA